MSDEIRSDSLAITPKLRWMLKVMAKARKMTGPEALANDLLIASLKQMQPDIEQRAEAYSKATLEAYNRAVEGI